MKTLLKDLYDCFYTPPEFSEQKQEVEECHQALIKVLEKPERRLVLRIMDAQSLMGYLDMGPTPVKNSRQQETMEMCYTEADTPGLWFPEVKAEQLISAGQMLGRIEDLEGRILQTIHARWDGMALYHTVSLGVTTGDALVAYGKIG